MKKNAKAIAAALVAVLGVLATLGYVDEATAAGLKEHVEILIVSGGAVMAAVWGTPNGE